MNDTTSRLAELEDRLLRDPLNAGARMEYARLLLSVNDEPAALEQYDVARKLGGTPELPEFERLRAPPPPPEPPPPREPVKLSVVQGARSAEVVSIARPVSAPDKTRFMHIAGMDDLKKSIRLQIIEPFLNPGLFAKFRKKAGGGILLYGPPGCGKTMLARAVANECNASFLAIGISEILSMWQGESERNLALMFEKARATGLQVTDWQNVILVNMIGQRFYDETGGAFTANNYDLIKGYVANSYLNARNIAYNPNNFLNAAMAGIGDGHNGGGPIWAIFDAAAVERQKWTPEPPFVDIAKGFFFTAGTIGELAARIRMKYQRVPMPPDALEATVARYNSFVDAGEDKDFGKPTPRHKIATPPFFAAWSTPVLHDTRAGLRRQTRPNRSSKTSSKRRPFRSNHLRFITITGCEIFTPFSCPP